MQGLQCDIVVFSDHTHLRFSMKLLVWVLAKLKKKLIK